MLTDQAIEHLYNGTLELDCPTMSLKRQCEEYPDVYSGPGIIQQDKSGKLVFRLFSDRCVEFMKNPFTTFYPGPGKVLQRENFYRLTATDSSGQIWESERILPQPANNQPGQSLIVKGEISRITRTAADFASGQSAVMDLTYFDDFEFPRNKTTEFKEIRDGEEFLKGFSRDRAEFHLGENKVEIKTKNKIHRVSVKLSGGIEPRILERKLTECLQFGFARPFRRASLRVWAGYGEMLELDSRPEGSFRERLKPPIRFNSVEGSEPLYHLIDCYFRYIQGYTRDQWHPISLHAYGVIESSAASLDAEALGVAMAVEGLLKDAFIDMATEQDELRDCVHTVQRTVTDMAMKPQYKERIKSNLGSMLKSRSADRLHELVVQGKIRKDHIEKWKELRNRWAHGGRPLSMSTGQIIELIDSVLVLFYCLVFAAIGYEGPFVDYSRSGWPRSQYPQSINGEDSPCNTPNAS